MNFLICLLVNGLAVFAASAILSGVQVDGYGTAVIVGLLLGVVNTFIKPIITFLTLPITILTLGLFILIINGAMVLMVDGLIDGFSVHGLFSAVAFSLLLAIFNLVIGGLDLKSGKAIA